MFVPVARKVLWEAHGARDQKRTQSLHGEQDLMARSNLSKSEADDAAGQVFPTLTELGAGDIGGLTLAPGLYKWRTGLLITADVTLFGGPNDVWIFRVGGALNQANATRVTLAGGARPKNIFWQVAGAVTIGTTAHFEGVVLGRTIAPSSTGASGAQPLCMDAMSIMAGTQWTNRVSIT